MSQSRLVDFQIAFYLSLSVPLQADVDQQGSIKDIYIGEMPTMNDRFLTALLIVGGVLLVIVGFALMFSARYASEGLPAIIVGFFTIANGVFLFSFPPTTISY